MMTHCCVYHGRAVAGSEGEFKIWKAQFQEFHNMYDWHNIMSLCNDSAVYVRQVRPMEHDDVVEAHATAGN